MEEACNAVSWMHASAGLSSLLADPFVKATLEGLQRSLAKPVVKKEPVTVDMVEAIVRYADKSGSLYSRLTIGHRMSPGVCWISSLW